MAGILTVNSYNGRYMMQNFVLAGKAKTVFRLIELKAKLEAEKKAENKQKRK